MASVETIAANAANFVESDLANALNQALPRCVHLAGSDAFRESNGSYFSALENELTPLCIVKPSTSETVGNFIKAVKHFIEKGACRIAVRGGGYTSWAGSSNVEGGITLDMRGLKGIQLNADKTVVRVGAGETWGTVYGELEASGLTVAGGRVGKVGVAGLILGGGLFHYSTQRGFVCDNVINFEVVLGSGQIVQANAQENADLWRALRGGSNNFGIVTWFDITTLKSTKIWGGSVSYDASTFPAHMQAMCSFASDLEHDENSHAMCVAGFKDGHQSVTAMFYHLHGVEEPPSLKRFTSIEPKIPNMDSRRISNHGDFCAEISKASNDGDRQHCITATIRPDISVMKSIYEEWQSSLESMKDVSGLIYSLLLQPITKTILQNSTKYGGNAQGLSPEDAPLLIICINTVWGSPSDDSRINDTVSKLVTTINDLARSRNLSHRYIFPNYAWKGQAVIQGYGEESVSKLRDIGARYDPEGFFQTGVPGGFKLPK